MASEKRVGTGLLPKLILGVFVPILLAFLIIGCMLFVNMLGFTSIRGLGLESLKELGGVSIKESTDSLNKLGEKLIEQKAGDVAREVETYLATHPGKPLSSLFDDPVLKEIAVQKIGETGYTIIADNQGIIKIHPVAASVGRDGRKVSPELAKIIDTGAAAGSSVGYYPWKETDGSIRQKFMALATIKDTGHHIAATSYIDEFSAPTKAIATKINQMRESYSMKYIGRFWLFVGIVVAALVVLLAVIYVYAASIVRPIRHLSEIADRISMGDMQATVNIRGKGEVMRLAESIERMQTSVRAAIERLQKRRETGGGQG